MAEADAVAWLNREMRGLAPSRASGSWTQRVAESGASDPQHVETRLAELHRRIRSARSEHAAEIETQIQRARANVPQAAEQAQQVAREATHFRAALQALHHSEPPAALACVHRLTDIQHRMQQARDLLQAADAWSYVEADVHAHIQERDYARAAQRIADVRDSLAQFAHSEHVSAQTAVLARLSDTLLREVQPVLAAAVTSGDVDAMELCAAVYARLQQDDALAELYLPARAERVHRVWADTDATLPAKMAQLGDALGALTDEEVHTFAPRLFGNEAAVVIAHTLATLSPRLATCVATAQAPLPDMVQAYEVAHAWAARLEALLRGATTQPVVQLRGSRDWQPYIEEAFAPFKAAYRAGYDAAGRLTAVDVTLAIFEGGFGYDQGEMGPSYAPYADVVPPSVRLDGSVIRGSAARRLSPILPLIWPACSITPSSPSTPTAGLPCPNSSPTIRRNGFRRSPDSRKPTFARRLSGSVRPKTGCRSGRWGSTRARTAPGTPTPSATCTSPPAPSARRAAAHCR